MNIDPKFGIDQKDHGKQPDSTVRIEMNYPDDNPKTKFGTQKPAMFNVPVTALLHLMATMADGAKKYGPYNWRDKDVSASVYYDAAMRHLMSWVDGEDFAEDSGVHHLGGVMACCAIILDAEAQGTLNDNRPVKGKFSELVKQMTRSFTIEKEDKLSENKEKHEHIERYLAQKINSLISRQKALSSSCYTIEGRIKQANILKKEIEGLIAYVNKAIAEIPALNNNDLLVYIYRKKAKAQDLLDEVNNNISDFTQLDEFGLENQ